MKKLDRQHVWRHNTLRGQCSLAMSIMKSIIASNSTTLQSKVKANEIHIHLQELSDLLKERKD